ncbi:transposase [Allorhodopirellula solitaria]|uniref:Transposase DDE domain-containing protein n=1 Tax=Allorhodopirellula solitaria TaxID=2527987 RepID=A0A5C5X1I7_9BACT|nr:transposase [Allorhodopirellula solitaria]TWT56003.1 hypothetical protein CA85_45940 [Allorhodopirellula solitaria]
MRYQQDPSQTELFDFYEQILSPVGYRRLLNGWQHLFRTAILRLMPVGRLAERFDPAIGRPTKELYSVAALLFVMEFRDWTHQEAADAYMFNVDVQYALNLRPENQSLCRRTIERYIELFREDELAADIMNDVTAELVKLLELDVSKQRLDSTHIESNMAKFGRIRLMVTAIKRFLTQIKRHDEGSYNALPRSVRDRYEAGANALFGWKKLEDDEIDTLRQSVAEDLLYLVERYRRNRKHHQRSTYLAMAKILEQQCEITDGTVELKKNTGGDVICNSSDVDATFDGHKGSGYQVQLSETYSSENCVQLIVAAHVETACTHDSHAIGWLLDHYQSQGGSMPQTLLADTAYGSDDNFQKCANGASWTSPLKPDHEATSAPVVKLVSPTSGKVSEAETLSPNASKPLTTLDFPYDASVNRFTHCPAGKELHRAHYRKMHDQHHLLMLSDDCRSCPLRSRCPMQGDPMLYDMRIDGKDLRLAQRRQAEETDTFRREYRKRGGIEATNSILKRVTGLSRLRVRGRPAMTTSTLLKVAGWNVLQATRGHRSRQKSLSAA